MRNNNSTFPIQKLALSKKTKPWKETSVDGIIGRTGMSRVGAVSRKDTMAINYELYNSNFDKDDLKYIVDPFDVGDTFPASPQEFNIIRPKVDLLIGEETKRPFNYMIIQTNDDAVTALQDKKKQMLTQYILSELGLTDEDLKTSTPPEIEKYMRSNYKTVAEKQANQSLNYLKEKLNLQDQFMRGWKDGLIAGEEIYYVGVNNGEPVLKRVNPLNCDYDGNADLENIADGDWFVYYTRMTAEEIYDTYYDKLDESDLNKLLDETRDNGKLSAGSNADSGMSYRLNISDTGVTNPFGRQYNSLDLYHVVWRSFQKIGFLTIENEYSDEEVIQVDETYIVQPGDKIEWEWVGQIWEGYKVSDDIYFGIEALDYVDTALDGPERQKLPYTGVIYSNTNSDNKSLVSIMKPLQYMYIVLWYRLELMIARDKGKVINMDITQIPKSMGITPEKWLHYLSAVGVNFINPYEEGYDIPGREGGKPASFNQISSQDLSMSNVIGGYIDLLAKIEDMIGEISGVSKARQGQIHQNSLVGNVEREVVQSSHITEPLFNKHSLAKKVAISMLLNTSRHAWKNSGKKKLHYIFSDTSRMFMDLTEDFLYSDFDIFATDSTKEHLNLQKIESLLQPAMQNGATLSEAAEVLTGNNITEIKEKLKEIDKRREQTEQSQAEQEQQMVQMQVQAENERASEENRIKEEDSIRKSQTSIEVALIQAENTEGGDDGFKDQLDVEKLRIDENKQSRELDLKTKQVNETNRKNKVDEGLHREEISIKRKAANKPTVKSN
jgi:hypothetical protein